MLRSLCSIARAKHDTESRLKNRLMEWPIGREENVGLVPSLKSHLFCEAVIKVGPPEFHCDFCLMGLTSNPSKVSFTRRGSCRRSKPPQLNSMENAPPAAPLPRMARPPIRRCTPVIDEGAPWTGAGTRLPFKVGTPPGGGGEDPTRDPPRGSKTSLAGTPQPEPASASTPIFPSREPRCMLHPPCGLIQTVR